MSKMLWNFSNTESFSRSPNRPSFGEAIIAPSASVTTNSNPSVRNRDKRFSLSSRLSWLALRISPVAPSCFAWATTAQISERVLSSEANISTSRIWLSIQIRNEVILDLRIACKWMIKCCSMDPLTSVLHHQPTKVMANIAVSGTNQTFCFQSKLIGSSHTPAFLYKT